VPQLFVKIPRDRIGALIGPEGEAKQRIEGKLQIGLQVDSQTGDVTIDLDKELQDPSLLFKAKDYVMAVGRGFSPSRAYKLLQDEENMLTVIDLREIFGRSPSDIQRVKGRIIGKEGKTRKIIEELSEASISVYGHTVSIIGGVEQTEIAREAVSMLIKGSQHVTVYRYLQRKRQDLKKKRLELWEDSTLFPAET
jgi:ribosomal RNA assembly protein